MSSASSSNRRPRIYVKESEYKNQINKKKVNYIDVGQGYRFVFSVANKRVCGVETIVDEEKKISRVDPLNQEHCKILEQFFIPVEEMTKSQIEEENERRKTKEDVSEEYTESSPEEINELKTLINIEAINKLQEAIKDLSTDIFKGTTFISLGDGRVCKLLTVSQNDHFLGWIPF